MLLDALGQRLRNRRLAAGLTQAQLAQQAGVSPRFLVQLEKGQGNISVQRLAHVCAVLEYPLSALFSGLGPGGPRTIALVGLRGAGKSTVGAALAARLAVPFVEVDAQIEVVAGLTRGEIFELRGPDAFRELEAQVLAQALTHRGVQVIATSGGLVTAADTWHALRQQARTVWLKASPQSHLERVVAQGDLRPMQGRPEARRELEQILDERAPLYAQADLTLDTDALGLAETVEALVGW